MSVIVRSLDPSDLPACGWAGSPTHLAYVHQALERAAAREVDYLGVFEDGRPVSIGGIDYAAVPGEGLIWQLATDPARQSEGFGSRLIGALEDAARSRGLRRVRLGVGDDNPRARRRYERLGYRPTAEIDHGVYDAEDQDGRVTTVHSSSRVMTKTLAD